MPYITTGLPNGGRTQYFTFQYDSALSQARGLDLATAVMAHSDDDLAQVVSWFSGRSLDTVLPINVSIATVATDSRGRPTEFVGASWSGYGLIPLQVTISIGELLMGSGTPQMFARYLLVSEVTEMYMRGMATLGLSQWFGNLDEGNKGEALSDFLATQFLLKNFPGVTSLPTVLSGSTRVTNLWLNSARDNFLEVADDDNVPNTKIGCCALFLFYLHDQLGYRIEEIINKGAHTLSEVYAQLTGDAAANAWIKFSTLVNTHYPNSRNASGNFTPRYNPMLETIFPVVDLVAVGATPQVTWASPSPPALNVLLGGPAPIPLMIDIESDHPEIIPPPTVTVHAAQASAATPFTVIPQPAGFLSRAVTLTASYAGTQRSALVMVYSPSTDAMPALVIDVDRSADPCQPLFVAGTSLTFGVSNLSVFGDQSGLSFSWSVTGTSPDATNGRTLTLSKLPHPGSTVKIDVTVANPASLRAKGSFSFKTVALDFSVLQGELLCRITKLRNVNLSIPPWVPIEKGGPIPEQLGVLDHYLTSVSRAARSVAQVVENMRQNSPRSGSDLR